ncbi:MAG: hypothetical protein M3R30_03840 [Candidatus Eremiobacteraeota bacterium]|nr:hypothetical protein [Candidatus Eremiobacteraeota bacterium]
MKRTSRATWEKRIDEWKASGQSPDEFARAHGVAESSLRWWKWRLRSDQKKSEAPPTPLTFVEMTAPVQREAFEIVLASNMRVRVPADFDEATLARLLDVLERRR